MRISNINQERIKNIEGIISLYTSHLDVSWRKEQEYYLKKIMEYQKEYKELTGREYNVDKKYRQNI